MNLLKAVANPTAAVDVIIENKGKILLTKRAVPPFLGKWVLPGGKVDYGETVERAAVREAKEETGLKIRLKEILGVYSDPKRDPRRHTVSTAFLAEVAGGELKTNFEASEFLWASAREALKKELGFDHKKILRDYAKRKKGQTFWSGKH